MTKDNKDKSQNIIAPKAYVWLLFEKLFVLWVLLSILVKMKTISWYLINYTGSPRFAPVQFAPIQNNADFETRRSKREKKYILLLFITFYNFSRTASYTKS
jgi:hypothetical protein